MGIILDGGRPGQVAAPVDGGSQSYTGSLGIVWIGSDGSTWDIASGPVRASIAGIKGLGKPDALFQTSSSPSLPGQRLRGVRLNPRTVFLPVRFKDAAATDVLGIQRRFWRSLGLGEYGRLVVTTPDGATRSLGCRFEDDGGYAYSLDPFTAFVTSIGLTLTADDPYFYGEPVSVSYSLDASSQVNFFGGGDPAATGFGPAFYLSSSTGSQSYTVANPGDVDAWPVWYIMGPATAFSVGVNGRQTASPMNIPAGSTLVINTDPSIQTATMVTGDPSDPAVLAAGTQVPFSNFTALNFAPIPRGAAVTLSMTITGTGSVGAMIRPRYERAF